MDQEAKEVIDFSAPGAAWAAAKDALKDGDDAKAEELLRFMLPSDQSLMRQRIQEYRDANAREEHE